MTVRDVVGLMLRRWYVLIMVLAAAGCLALAYDQDSGCYTTDTVVTFTLPSASPLQPDSGATDSSVIAFASAIANEINAGEPNPRYAHADAPFYGAGVRQGISVGLPHSGSQWEMSFPTAAIHIQIVGRTSEWVEKRQTSAIARINAAVQEQQKSSKPSEHISTSIQPLSTQIAPVMPSRSDRLMAFAAMGLAALVAGAVLSVLCDDLVSRIGRRRVAPSANPLQVRAALGPHS